MLAYPQNIHVTGDLGLIWVGGRHGIDWNHWLPEWVVSHLLESGTVSSCSLWNDAMCESRTYGSEWRHPVWTFTPQANTFMTAMNVRTDLNKIAYNKWQNLTRNANRVREVAKQPFIWNAANLPLPMPQWYP